MAVAGFYRRILPSPPAIDFSSSEGKKLFLEAIHDGKMEGFFKLISYFQTQSEPAYCGLATLSMVLNALAIDPGRKWKGPWRWFDESMLDCCEPLEKVKETGITFGKVMCLANCAGAKAEAFHANQSSIDAFRDYVSKCSSSDDCHLIVSYHRGTFKQTGTGHFSPIGGYHAKNDMALILDTARFKYPPHWVPLTLLWEAMSTVDESTGKQRGFMLISKNQRAPGLLYTLSCKHESWIRTTRYLMDDVPALLSSCSVKNVSGILSTIFASLPPDFSELIKRVVEVRPQEDTAQVLSQEEKGRINVKEAIFNQVKETSLFAHVADVLQTEELSKPEKCKFCVLDTLPNLAASICCQGAGILMGKSWPLERLCCRDASVRCYSATADGNENIAVVSGTVVDGTRAQVVDVLVPLSQTESNSCKTGSECYSSGVHPHSPDVLTALLLALPPQTWSNITDKKVLDDISALVSTDGLPLLLQEEILHLRNQLVMLKNCKEDKIEPI